MAAASRLGTAHLASGLPCQDQHELRLQRDESGRETLIAVVADGAGSASHSDLGAAMLCEAVAEQAQRFLAGGQELATCARADIDEWLAAGVAAHAAYAARHGLDPRELAATCLLCVAGPEAAVCAQVGDGGMVVDDGDGFAPVFWPERGEYANTTSFVTVEAIAGETQFIVLPRPLARVALFSDGLQMLALHYATRSAPAGFFAPLFGALEAQPPGRAGALDAALAEMLDRPRITERTDDDRTLVLASRRQP